MPGVNWRANAICYIDSFEDSFKEKNCLSETLNIVAIDIFIVVFLGRLKYPPQHARRNI